MATPSRPPAGPAPPAEPPEVLEPAERAARSLEQPLARLTPDDLQALNEAWRDAALADDDEAKTTARRIAARLRRAKHEELHPGCVRVEIDVPPLRLDSRGDGVWFVQINNQRYHGRVEVWQCEAQTILELVHRAREVEAARLRSDGRDRRPIDLDRETLAARVQAIRRA
jgi:hypothetical protein